MALTPKGQVHARSLVFINDTPDTLPPIPRGYFRISAILDDSDGYIRTGVGCLKVPCFRDRKTGMVNLEIHWDHRAIDLPIWIGQMMGLCNQYGDLTHGKVHLSNQEPNYITIPNWGIVHKKLQGALSTPNAHTHYSVG
jgi:hypothetical protein